MLKMTPIAPARTTACQTSAAASSWRSAPSARATADATPPPNPPFDIISISISIGKTNATPASASVPRKLTKYVSITPTSVWTIRTAIVGKASRSMVGAIGPDSTPDGVARRVVGSGLVESAVSNMGGLLRSIHELMRRDRHQVGLPGLSHGGTCWAAPEAIEREIDDRRRVEGQELRHQQAADHREAERLPDLRAGAVADGKWHAAEQRCHCRHHDRPEAQTAAR